MEFRELFYNVTDIDPFRTPHHRLVLSSCIAPTTFPKIRSASFHRWDVAPRTISRCLRTNGCRRRPITTKSISNTHATVARNANYLLDGYHEETHTTFEVHLCFWHGYPRCYTRDTVNLVNSKTMQELHHCTVANIEYLKR